jgi:thioredoxin 1
MFSFKLNRFFAAIAVLFVSVLLSNCKTVSEAGRFKELEVVVFWALEWCEPSRKFEPIFEELAKDFSKNERIKFLKIDTDDNPEMAKRFGIRGVPTVKLIKDGKEVDQHIGAASKEVLSELILEYLK